MDFILGTPEHATDILEIRRQVRAATYSGYAPGITPEYIDELNQLTLERIRAEETKLADDHYGYWVVQDGDKAVAYQKVEGLPRQSVNFLHVLPAYQGQGIGGKLIECAIDWFEPGEVFVEVTVGNERARRLYENLGWRATGAAIDSLPIPGGGFLQEEEMVRIVS